MKRLRKESCLSVASSFFFSVMDQNLVKIICGDLRFRFSSRKNERQTSYTSKLHYALKRPLKALSHYYKQFKDTIF